MEPESDIPSPRTPPAVVSVPVALYNLMALCYYGSGPRHAQAPAQAVVETRTIPNPQPEGDLDAPRQVLVPDALPAAYRPRGYAARPPKPVKEDADAQ